jgi:hypothetical protein
MAAKEQDFTRKESKLYTRKEKLYLEANTKAWEIPTEVIKKYTAKQLVGDKSLAMKLILPKDTRELELTCTDYGYYLNMIIEENRRVNLQNYRKMRKHIKQLADDQATFLREMGSQWSSTSQRLSDKLSKKPANYRENLLKKITEDLVAYKPSKLII